jgi:hypothetical protein
MDEEKVVCALRAISFECLLFYIERGVLKSHYKFVFICELFILKLCVFDYALIFRCRLFVKHKLAR